MVPPSSFNEFGVQAVTVTLIPGLPNDVGALILAFVPYSHQSRLKSVCKSWRCFLSSKTLIDLRQKYLITSELLCIVPDSISIYSPYIFDPKNRAWCPLPPIPCNPHLYDTYMPTTVSVGPNLYVLGGYLCVLQPFPLDQQTKSWPAFRFDFAAFSWDTLAPMITPRGGFARAAIPEHGKIVVAGGVSTHPKIKTSTSVELYDIEKDEWVALDGLPSSRVGAAGLFTGGEFWVMGGYGESRTGDGIHRDAVVMDIQNGGKWREVGDMWEGWEGESLGRIVMINDGGFGSPMIFMLDEGKIFRYDMSFNRWPIETYVPTPRKVSNYSPVGFVAFDGELHLLTFLTVNNLTKLLIRIYHPRKRTWRFLVSKPSTKLGIRESYFNAFTMCTIEL